MDKTEDSSKKKDVEPEVNNFEQEKLKYNNLEDILYYQKRELISYHHLSLIQRIQYQKETIEVCCWRRRKVIKMVGYQLIRSYY
jgi:SHS2 domain-containing protein